MRIPLLTLLLALLCRPCAAAPARYAVNAGGISEVVDAGGHTVLSGDAIASVFEVRPGALYAAGQTGDYALYDADGARLGEERFQMIDDMGGWLVFRQGGLYGAMDAAGSVVIEPRWTQLAADGAGGFLALQDNPLDEQPDEVIRLEPDGTQTFTGVYVDGGLSPLREGRMPFRAPDGRYGCLDGAGAAAIPAEWAWIGDFSDGAAPVSDGALYGLIDAAGAAVIEPRFTWLQRGDGLWAGLSEDNTAELYAADGLRRLCAIPAPSGEATLAGRCLAVREADGWALYTDGGARIVEASPEALFFPGLPGQVVVSDGPFGEPCQRVVSMDGAAVSDPCQRILPLGANRYAVQTFGEDFSDLRCGLMDGAGRQIMDAQCLEIALCGEDRLTLLTDDAVVFADLDGQPIRTWRRAE